MDFFNCQTLTEARRLVLAYAASADIGSEIVELAAAAGRIAAVDCLCREELPSFPRSTVDGFAVRSADTFAAGEGIPALLTVIGEVAMGQTTTLVLGPGQAAAVPTGGMLPGNADAVVMLEHTERVDDRTLLVTKPVAPGDNSIARGEDAMPGAVLVRQGQKLTPLDIGVLAACGFAKVSVYRRLKVGVLSTGDEIVDVSVSPQPGQVRDINSYALAALLESAGYTAVRYGIIGDNYASLQLKLAEAAAACDAVLVSGGSSVGARDYTVKAIEALGGPGVLLHGIAVKPGKPTIFGMVGAVPVFGLPGHPVSALIIYHQLVRPALAVMAGEKAQRVFKVPAKMSRNVASAPGRDEIIRVRLLHRDGEYWAEPVFGKSGLISTMTEADGLVVIAPEKSGLYAGEQVEVEMLRC
ncbi:molybdenum cofactor synthesis domain [Thermosinus carboxydivorans Nor1]|uniref:Molybdopterin molybdenumtransferase n=1 Tax=Thermosinus carboxydivorans Nor1 TaxID=401526 RepID=A1HS20_9FIRM|nr:gephyrin-like molybdotransferase Glp [Thermosinus carboxydivorans]EAX47195.1 molybdenum cofactor synthesis domain [Thermosinus carboxydivorans Nor1]